MVLNSFASFVHSVVMTNWHPTWQSKLFILCLFASICAMLSSLIYQSKWFSKALSIISTKTVHGDMLNELVDFKEGTRAIAVLNDGSICTGAIYKIEEKGAESFVALEDYALRIANVNNSTIIKSIDYDNPNIVIIRLTDVARLQLLYTQSSEIGKDLIARRNQ